ncbi:hypothetical protein EDB83DRAFT_2524755 [Lactarius deliciosus]|nr:hypothetical protein EDB83DRAFT_2524755 [Lactarius deliciosus]
MTCTWPDTRAQALPPSRLMQAPRSSRSITIGHAAAANASLTRIYPHQQSIYHLAQLLLEHESTMAPMPEPRRWAIHGGAVLEPTIVHLSGPATQQHLRRKRHTFYSSSSAKRRISASSSTGTFLHFLYARNDGGVATRAHSAAVSDATAAIPMINHGTLAKVSTKPASDAPKRGWTSLPGARRERRALVEPHREERRERERHEQHKRLEERPVRRHSRAQVPPATIWPRAVLTS